MRKIIQFLRRYFCKPTPPTKDGIGEAIKYQSRVERYIKRTA